MSEFVSLGDTVYFGVTVHNPSGGALINADTTPVWSSFINSSDTIVQQGNFTLRTGIVGTYRANLIASAANGYSSGNYVEIHASGVVGGIQGRSIVKTFVINDVFDCNVVQVSGININYPDIVPNPIYFAGIKFIHDGITPNDEYVVQWFKNSTPLGSGQVTNASLSVYNTNSNSSLFMNKVLNYQSVSHGGLRYNEVTNIAVSGEPYLAVASGTIDGATRVWTNPIGLDYLS